MNNHNSDKAKTQTIKKYQSNAKDNGSNLLLSKFKIKLLMMRNALWNRLVRVKAKIIKAIERVK